jgi:hypothetical protein
MPLMDQALLVSHFGNGRHVFKWNLAIALGVSLLIVVTVPKLE